uniref:NAC domain protein n=1 Tax=Tamarix hispida TaxID=189793 RepID=I6XH30_9CARY|nr:NAC domain protein [Tamarix hispida]
MISKEAAISIEASSIFPGFRFSPTDEELLLYYLKKKLEGCHKCVEVIPEVDICKFEPWDLPGMSVIQSDSEWFFFSPRGRKYPNGSQSKRATEVGYWKATGKERDVKSGCQTIGTKRTLVFHMGRAPKGDRTEWIMHEYCMSGKSQDQDSLVACRLRKKADFHFGDVSNYEPGRRPLLGARSATTGKCSGFGSDQTQMSSTDRTVEASKKCSSSYGSDSVEQTDCTSESEKIVRDEIVKPESSNAQQKHDQQDDGMDDCFAEILNDNIVDLGSPFTAALSSLQSQGTASRRIRLKKLRVALDRATDADHKVSYDQEHSDKNGLAKKGSRLSLKSNVNRLYIVVAVTMMLVVFCISFLGTWQVKRSSYGVTP